MSPAEQTILNLERAALDRWGKGDPGGYLEISAPDTSYFDPFVDRRVDGFAALAQWYKPIRGKIRIDRDEIVAPRVQLAGDAAVLSFQFVSHGSEGSKHWNATEVYRRVGAEWHIIHTHWSFTKPQE
jgi:ketosteroid isomerase-like protein